MQKVLILLDDVNEWKPFYQTKSILSVSDYLQLKTVGDDTKIVINLSNSLKYNEQGYYCSLLAQARGHRVIPGVEVLNRIDSGSGMRLDRNLQKLFYHWMQKNAPDSDKYNLKVYFGNCVEKGLEKIARYVFENYPAPILEVLLSNRSSNPIDSINIIKLNDLSDGEQDAFAETLDYFNKKVWRNPKLPKSTRYSLAIFHDPNEVLPPSDGRSLKKFVQIAKKMNIYAELITEEDINRLMEFDALFIRSTTSLNHITYNLALKAKLADMVVIDDPLSIIRCTNKVYLNELLNKAKIPAPKSKLIFKSSLADYNEVVEFLGSPFVVKIPDGSFSHGIKKVKNQIDYETVLNELFSASSIVLAQEFIPTDYDWRIGVLNGEPLYACKYFMARGHWQIYYHSKSGKSRCGNVETVPIYKVPQTIIKTAVKASSLIGKGLYGVDLKMINNKAVVIEINDNPSIDYEIEDAILGDELYYRIINHFVRVLEKKHNHYE
ncbi:MAG: RimK family protein [Bacteroidales bacterium]|nr:RimK family protein [Bacteroidales bacterium]